MTQVHILPTDKPSKLIKQTNGKLRLSEITFKGQIASGVTQNIYITDSTLTNFQQGDWFISKEGDLHNNFGWNFGDTKIILTTDKELIHDGVQKIDEDLFKKIVASTI
jgi:hypothetical protein